MPDRRSRDTTPIGCAQSFEIRGTIPTIPGRRNQERPIQYDDRCYGDRWLVEAMFCRLKNFRRVANRHGKLARNYQSAVALAAAIVFWL
ncbi:hypothetical protein NOVOSPHI9U_130002 [Novosphingobium sp. 9U]|nr:hypothetical protein NOVOSPHI9U_130002 [Novosphingobium sp. 9U]